MARKPNYSYERHMREKAKADKKEAKRLAKAAAKEDRLAAAEEAGVDPMLEVPELAAVPSRDAEAGEETSGENAGEDKGSDEAEASTAPR